MRYVDCETMIQMLSDEYVRRNVTGSNGNFDVLELSSIISGPSLTNQICVMNDKL